MERSQKASDSTRVPGARQVWRRAELERHSQGALLASERTQRGSMELSSILRPAIHELAGQGLLLGVGWG